LINEIGEARASLTATENDSGKIPGTIA